MLTPLALVALLSLAPVMAQETDAQTACPEGQVETPEGCSDQAWVDGCPPEMLCAASADNETTPQECDADVCDPVAYGNESCIECSGPVPFGNESCIDCSGFPGICMDGADANETCDDDVQYLDGRGPAGCENCRGDDAEADPTDVQRKDAPGLASALLLVGLAAVAGFVRRR